MDQETVISNIVSIVRENPYYIYESIDNRCFYHKNREKEGRDQGCLIGRALFMDDEVWEKFNLLRQENHHIENLAAEHLIKELKLDFDRDIIVFLLLVQEYQDGGIKWITCLKMALKDFNEIPPELKPVEELVANVDV